ncbi:MAG: sigma-70 family RNA polymerase sigma factor [Candidatus Dadabacteria bacterium]|nr:sigma-70 family RNA polymerase sigma factor [Candidatus Dadabacteria bacterium]MCZ6864960.1 sigma-70 family RNA polymerase sigma factor [Candidatus Dadabacteria bacterium]
MESDIELMLRTKAGDDDAFSELMKRHYKGVLNYIYRFTNLRENSEDLAQEVFLRVYRSATKYRPEAKFTTWLYRIATNVSLTYVKKKNKNVSLDEMNEKTGEIEDPGVEISDDIIYRKEIKNVIFSAMESLPEREKVAIMLCKYEGLSYEETADVLECTVGAVKAYVHRGRMKLVNKLKPYLTEEGEYGV